MNNSGLAPMYVEVRIVRWRWRVLQIYQVFLLCLRQMISLCRPFLTDDAVNHWCNFLLYCWDDAYCRAKPLWYRSHNGKQLTDWKPMEFV